MAIPSPLVNSYDPSQVIVTFGGIPLSGFADETFVTIKRSNGGVYSKKRGADGTVERVNKCSYDFTVEITLQQTSNSNLVLDGLMKVDLASNAGVLPLAIKDNQGTTLFVAPNAWINEDPEVSFGNDTTSRKWVFETGPASLTVGGNALVTP